MKLINEILINSIQEISTLQDNGKYKGKFRCASPLPNIRAYTPEFVIPQLFTKSKKIYFNLFVLKAISCILKVKVLKELILYKEVPKPY